METVINPKTSQKNNDVKIKQIAIILTSLFTLINGLFIAYLSYNQSSKDKMTDFKIEQMRQENESKTAENNRNIAIIYGEMFNLLHRLDADRCFILQPHPLLKSMYVSVAIEVTRNGVSNISDVVRNIPISDLSIFVKELATNRWIFIDDIESQVSDLRVKSILRIAGATTVCIKQLNNIREEWIGSLVIEYTTKRPLDDNTQFLMRSTANTIQFILPPIN